MSALNFSTFGPGVPAWVHDLVRLVCDEAGLPLPDRVSWRPQPGEQTSHGVTRSTLNPVRVAISVFAGTSEVDARHCLLHELAHYLESGSGEMRRDRREGGFSEVKKGSRRDPHNVAFFTRAAALFARHGTYPLAEAIKREVLTYPTHRHDLAAGLRGAGLGEYATAVWEAQVARHAAAREPDEILVEAHPIVADRAGTRWVCSSCGARISPRTAERCALAVRLGLPPLGHQLVRRAAVALELGSLQAN
jgi:hypothetical protein